MLARGGVRFAAVGGSEEEQIGEVPRHNGPAQQKSEPPVNTLILEKSYYTCFTFGWG